MARKQPPSFDFYPDDFLGGTDYMTAEEVGVYFRLLLHQWQRGHVEDDPSWWKRILKADNLEVTVRFVLSEKFVKENGHYINERMANDRKKAIKRYRACIENGRKGGRPKKIRQSDTENPGVSDGFPSEKPKRNPVGRGKMEDGRGKTDGGSGTGGEGRRKIPYSPDFERFWLAYPKHRRTGKGDAWGAWQKAIKDYDQELIILQATAYGKSHAGNNGQYTKQPATWLNKRCWEDEPEAWELGAGNKDPDPRGNIALTQRMMEECRDQQNQ